MCKIPVLYHNTDLVVFCSHMVEFLNQNRSRPMALFAKNTDATTDTIVECMTLSLLVIFYLSFDMTLSFQKKKFDIVFQV